MKFDITNITVYSKYKSDLLLRFKDQILFIRKTAFPYDILYFLKGTGSITVIIIKNDNLNFNLQWGYLHFTSHKYPWGKAWILLFFSQLRVKT